MAAPPVSIGSLAIVSVYITLALSSLIKLPSVRLSMCVYIYIFALPIQYTDRQAEMLCETWKCFSKRRDTVRHFSSRAQLCLNDISVLHVVYFSLRMNGICLWLFSLCVTTLNVSAI
jgi:hypothetical protein